MKITFNIEAENPQELLSAIQALAQGGITVEAAPLEKSKKGKTVATVAEPTPKAEETKVEPSPVVEAKTEPEKPKLTIVEVRAKLADLSRQNKQAQVKELIVKFGGEKLTDIPADKYDELMAAAQELG